jgi:N-acetylmuramoyl-L-alanine amidase
MVLLAPDVPAVLLEMGFITNPQDELALADGRHRRRMMAAVTQAIDAYFETEGRYGLS